MTIFYPLFSVITFLIIFYSTFLLSSLLFFRFCCCIVCLAGEPFLAALLLALFSSLVAFRLALFSFLAVCLLVLFSTLTSFLVLATLGVIFISAVFSTFGLEASMLETALTLGLAAEAFILLPDLSYPFIVSSLIQSLTHLWYLLVYQTSFCSGYLKLPD